MITFIGGVSNQEESGEEVTISVTRPDTQIETLTAYTLDDKSFMLDYLAPAGNGYVAIALIGEDDLFLAATSESVTFDVGKEPRTIVLSIK